MQELKHLIIVCGPTIVSIIAAILNWTKKDLALAISEADKKNNGQLSNTELEDIAVALIKNSSNPYLKMLPESWIRALIHKLCATRWKLFKSKNTPTPLTLPSTQVNLNEVTNEIK